MSTTINNVIVVGGRRRHGLIVSLCILSFNVAIVWPLLASWLVLKWTVYGPYLGAKWLYRQYMIHQMIRAGLVDREPDPDLRH